MQPYAIYGHPPLMGAINHHAHVTECLQGGKAVFALKKAFHLGNSFRERTKHD